MNIKLIALDMDGTTLNDSHEVTKENRAAIDLALAQGIEVIVSTGRSNTELLPLWDQFPQIRYFSCGNGSKIYDRNQDLNIFEDLLSFDQAIAILSILKKHDVFSEIYAGKEIYAEKWAYDNMKRYVTPDFEELVKQTRTPIHDLSAFLDQSQQPVEKVNAFFSDLAIRDKIVEACTELEVSVTNALGINLEMNSPTASKGNALHHLCQKLGIAASEVMAIGDGSNDISMLTYAGCSIAMENAVDEAKSAARFLTLSNENSGVAASIHQYALN